jgi:PAS domain S-box-containing protein
LLQIGTRAPLKKIIHISPGNIFFKDLKGIYKIVNLNYAKYLNKSVEEVIGKTDFDLFDSQTAEELQRGDKAALDKGSELEIEETDRRTGKIYLSKKTPLYNFRNKPIGIYGVSFDITERKAQEKALAEALEKAEAANKAKTAFLSNISHDMRTPLAGILGALDLIKMQSSPTSKLEKLYEGAKKSGQILLTMINRVLDAAEREHTGLVINKEIINLKELTTDCKEMYELTAQKKGIKFNLNYQAKDHFFTDYFCAEEILLNLIGNAIKFTEEGEVNVRVEDTDKGIKIIVQDTGIGISKEMHDAIFEKFNRVERSDRSKYPGHGLGLAKVKTSVEALGGQILLRSAPGKGATFEVCIGA